MLSAGLAALAGSALTACRYGVADAGENPPARREPTIDFTDALNRMDDTVPAVLEMLKAANRPKAMVRWLDNDSAMTGHFHGMTVDMTAKWPDFAIHFHDPSAYFRSSDERRPDYHIGLVSIANDADGDGRVFGFAKDAYDQGRPWLDSGLQAVHDAYAGFPRFSDEAAKCGTDSCKIRLAGELEAWTDSLRDAAAWDGYRKAKAGGLKEDWPMSGQSSLVVLWIPDEYNLGRARERFKGGNCNEKVPDFNVGYNLLYLEKEFPRMKTISGSARPAPDSASAFLFSADWDDLTDRSIRFSCSLRRPNDFRFREKIYPLVPPQFQLGLGDMDWRE